MNVARREILKTTFAAVAASARWLKVPAAAAAEELKVSANAATHTFDFEGKGLEGWTRVDGQWAVE